MIWVLAIVGLLVGFLLVPYVVGLVLRDDYESRVDLVLPAPRETVWAELQNFEAHPFSGLMARRVEAEAVAADGEGAPAWVEDLGNTRIRVYTEELVPLERWRVQMVDQVVPMDSTWTIELEDHEDGTRVHASNRTVVRSGSWRSPLFRLILRSSGATEKVLREYFRSIAGALHVTARLVPPAEASDTSGSGQASLPTESAK